LRLMLPRRTWRSSFTRLEKKKRGDVTRNDMRWQASGFRFIKNERFIAFRKRAH